MLRTLDPHSNYYDRKSFEEMRLEQRSQYYGSVRPSPSATRVSTSLSRSRVLRRCAPAEIR
jgi:hypothetical protein